MRNIKVLVERYPIAGHFTIARGSKTEAAVVVVEITEGASLGRGECVPYTRYGESIDGVVAAIESVRSKIESGQADRRELQKLLPAGAARNAIDCAFWDLEAKQSGTRAFQTAGVKSLRTLTTAFTISLGDVESMVSSTIKSSERPILKIKLGAPDGDIERIHAVRKAAPNAILIADANEAWTEQNLVAHLRACKEARFSLVEQPLPAGKDQILKSVNRIVPICADESVHGLESLGQLVGLYDFVNIKLDKTGGLTEALQLAERAKQNGLGIMVGCMVATSLAMAPAMLIASDAQFVDLDGPLLLSRDRENGLKFHGSEIEPPEPALWG